MKVYVHKRLFLAPLFLIPKTGKQPNYQEVERYTNYGKAIQYTTCKKNNDYTLFNIYVSQNN